MLLSLFDVIAAIQRGASFAEKDRDCGCSAYLGPNGGGIVVCRPCVEKGMAQLEEMASTRASREENLELFSPSSGDGMDPWPFGDSDGRTVAS